MALIVGLALAAAPTHSLVDGGMEVLLEVKGDDLVVDATAPTTGWLAVAFDTGPGLAGARLVMLRVDKTEVTAEVHRADPPRHARLLPPGIAEPVRKLSGSHSDGRTRVRFAIPLAASAPLDVTLVPGGRVHVEIAWSREGDFQHHSAFRGGFDLVL